MKIQKTTIQYYAEQKNEIDAKLAEIHLHCEKVVQQARETLKFGETKLKQQALDPLKAKGTKLET